MPVVDIVLKFPSFDSLLVRSGTSLGIRGLVEINEICGARNTSILRSRLDNFRRN